VFYARPLAHPKKWMALHVFRGQSGHALKGAGVVVRYVCSDGDSGSNKQHNKFFKEWHSARLSHRLPSALDIVDLTRKIPVSDFLYLWKNFCNKVKNHPVAISPEIPDDVLTCQNRESLLNFGNALSDKSSIGPMHDSYALQLFSLANCLYCMEEDGDLALLYLLPWALQEELIRSSALTRREGCEKAILSSYL
jgi:hypothetical protein